MTSEKLAELRALAEAARDAQAQWHADVCAATTLRFHDAIGELRHAIREPAVILALLDRVISELPEGWDFDRIIKVSMGPGKVWKAKIWEIPYGLRRFSAFGTTPKAAVAAAVAKIGEPT